jgi:NAD(P)-dependent dehydrogenase (short-subunit alcohol dehydrogenase family)
MVNEIERRYGSGNVHATSLHPGEILTDLMQHIDQSIKMGMALDRAVRKTMKGTEQGSATTVWATYERKWKDIK